ncbi:hypothetical protein C0585_06000 [Candidatus Woesearchaeota archaeon]|nr:MAG: hypothetical protein C0585_06000 [Candidatus Woesearchaeota archaeon]
MNDKTKKIFALGFASLAVLGGATAAVAYNGNGIADGSMSEDCDGTGIGSQDGLGMGSQGEFKGHGPMFEQNDEVTAAIEAEDYDAFLEATGNSNIGEDQFNNMVEMHNLHEAVEEAIEDGDYEAWLEAVSQMPNGENMAEVIEAEDFDTLIELHNTQERSRELREELGLDEIRGMGGQGKGRQGSRGMGGI